MKLYVTLQQIYHGEAFHIAFKRPVLCLHADDCVQKRPDCSAIGVSTVVQQIG